MSRSLVTFAVNNYCPEVCSLTFPNLREYASRIGAEFIAVTERKFSSAWHPVYEKLQTYDIAKSYDFTLLIDADMVLHPKFPDVLSQLDNTQCGSWMEYKINSRALTLWPTSNDQYFIRDARNLGVVGSLVACSKYTRDIFKPLGPGHDPAEVQSRLYRPAIVDEYVMSRNVAKYGLKHAALWPAYHGIYHAEATTRGSPDIEKLKGVLKEWKS